MVDFDYFKRINDTLGHQAGDLVLKHMANLLRANCRAGDYLCRYGGEEMCVLLPNADEEVAASWAERARLALEAAVLPVGDREVRATASFGVSARGASGDTTEQLIERADQSLIVAKKLGRNRVIRAGATSESGAVFEQVRQQSLLFQGVTAGQVMTTPVSTLPSGVNVAQATEFLRQLRINSAPVVDALGKLVGIVSEKDLICVLPHRNSWTLPVERIMQRTFVSFEEDAPLDAICDFLSRVTVRRVFIVRGGVPVGVVTQGSLLRWYGGQIAAQGIAPAGNAAKPIDAATQDRLSKGAKAVAHCAAELAKDYSGAASDPLAPVIEGMRRLQDLTDALIASSQGQTLAISLTESDSFPSALVSAVLPHATH
jgi:diguanylate cyclase (GGDEF)-like protein